MAAVYRIGAADGERLAADLRRLGSHSEVERYPRASYVWIDAEESVGVHQLVTARVPDAVRVPTPESGNAAVASAADSSAVDDATSPRPG